MWETRLGTFRFFLSHSVAPEASLSWLAGVKHLLILSYKGIEIFITTVMLSGVLLSIPLPPPTYADYEPVNMATITTAPIVPITLTATAGTTEKVSVAGKPSVLVKRNARLLAQQGESQEVIDAIIKTFPDEPVMVEIARCESKLNPSADRLGIDGGLFQINQVHLATLKKLGLDRYNLQDNLTYTKILHSQAGLTPWNMSRYCWGSYT